jgi:hypothetical protein
LLADFITIKHNSTLFRIYYFSMSSKDDILCLARIVSASIQEGLFDKLKL